MTSVPTPAKLAGLPAANVLPPITNCVTVSVLLSTSVSFASTLPESGVSSSAVPVSALATGASLTGVTFSVRVLGVVSKPPALSCTLKPMLAYGAPLPFGAGTNTSLPAARSAALTMAPAATATPFSISVPAAGTLSMRTAASVWPASASLKPRSATVTA